MSKLNIYMFLMRIALGAVFLYAGISKLMNPGWSAAGYLNSAKTFPGLYQWFASAGNIGWVNLMNEWGLTLVGALLIVGLFTRWAALGGILFMVLYYFPILNFPYAGEHAFLVDEHIVYITGLLVLYASNSGKFWGVDKFRS